MLCGKSAFAPLLSETESMNCRSVIEALLKGLERGKKDFGVDFGVITCAMRHHSQEDNSRMIKTAPGVSGIWSVRRGPGRRGSLLPNVTVHGAVYRHLQIGNALYSPCRRVRKRAEHCGFCKSMELAESVMELP